MMISTASNHSPNQITQNLQNHFPPPLVSMQCWRRTLLPNPPIRGRALVPLLKSCTRAPDLRQIHAHMIKAGLDLDPFTMSKLLASSVHADFAYARSIFDRIPNPNLFNFNAMLRGHSMSENPELGEAFSLFNSIRGRWTSPDQFSFISTLKSCSRKLALHAGRQLHGTVVGSGFELYGNLRNTLIALYCSCGVIGDAQQLFDDIPQKRDAVSWSALMGGYLQSSRPNKVVELFREMQSWGLEINPAVVVCVLSASSGSMDRCTGESVHGYCIKAGFCLDLNVASSIIAMYGKSRCMDSAQQVFDSMPQRDVVVWNCIVDGYAKCGLIEESFAVLRQMKVEGMKANAATLAGLLSACASSGALHVGQLIHRYVEEEFLALDPVLGTALIDMYSKCGFIEKAVEIFDGMQGKDVKSWTAMITGFGVNGRAEAALQLLHDMEEDGRARPNEVTFMAVLSACSHGGLVVAGKECFEKMVRRYGFPPKIEHYGCVIDLFGRAGLLGEAHELIKSLPIQGDATAWRALLAACRIHGDVELAEVAQQSLVELGDEHPTDSILLSNTYAVARKPVDLAKVTHPRGGGKTRKEAGCSSIEMGG